MSELYAIIMEGDKDIYHHGIKGQKWGIRRYQNPDGTLTPEGVERYRKKYGDLTARIRSMVTEKDTIDGKYSSYKHNDKVKQQWDEASTIGLMALNKMTKLNDMDPYDDGDREWFLFEDQTLGMPEVANLINKGHDVKKVKKLISEVYDTPYGTRFKDDTSREFHFAVLCGNYDKTLEKFADFCAAEKKKIDDEIMKETDEEIKREHELERKAWNAKHN